MFQAGDSLPRKRGAVTVTAREVERQDDLVDVRRAQERVDGRALAIRGPGVVQQVGGVERNLALIRPHVEEALEAFLGRRKSAVLRVEEDARNRLHGVGRAGQPAASVSKALFVTL